MQQQYTQQLSACRRPCLPVPARCRRVPCRRVAVKAAVAAPVEGQQAQQATSQAKGYKDALLVQCEQASDAAAAFCTLSPSISGFSDTPSSCLLFLCSVWMGQLPEGRVVQDHTEQNTRPKGKQQPWTHTTSLFDSFFGSKPFTSVYEVDTLQISQSSAARPSTHLMLTSHHP